ncbi:homocysteine S-methyltransferase [Streptomyces sp. MBT65]|uniref:homocysteine S-methyltransferase n=1 Tax=Streptomyces sp. MBT65 TaxID=1488395 RepID=UPI00190B79CC|nr:homocysteine S-methyltransferase [Streptomyces sp. MBT65]MBK3580170.1 homocysteine S-methyltransferase [Streptomyces sp. MBT65]
MTSDTSAPLTDALAAGTLVLDGGLSNQLGAAGHDLSDELWSARLLADEPGAITEAHLAYYEAGADVAITSSYQATIEGFAKRGVEREKASELIGLSVELALDAAVETWRRGVKRPLYVAASVGPYGAMLADGSEYRGRYGLSVAELEAFHRPRIEALDAVGPDVLALETIPDTVEAEALLRAVRGLRTPAWLSYSIAGDRTRAGQPLEEAFALAADADEIIAVGVNCCAPEDVEGAVEIAARVTGKPVVVYPNSGEVWDAEARAWTGRSTFTTEQVASWRAAGARLIGGCCRVGPGAITSIRQALTPS